MKTLLILSCLFTLPLIAMESATTNIPSLATSKTDIAKAVASSSATYFTAKSALALAATTGCIVYSPFTLVLVSKLAVPALATAGAYYLGKNRINSYSTNNHKQKV